MYIIQDCVVKNLDYNDGNGRNNLESIFVIYIDRNKEYDEISEGEVIYLRTPSQREMRLTVKHIRENPCKKGKLRRFAVIFSEKIDKKSAPKGSVIWKLSKDGEAAYERILATGWLPFFRGKHTPEDTLIFSPKIGTDVVDSITRSGSTVEDILLRFDRELQ